MSDAPQQPAPSEQPGATPESVEPQSDSVEQSSESVPATTGEPVTQVDAGGSASNAAGEEEVAAGLTADLRELAEQLESPAGAAPVAANEDEGQPAEEPLLPEEAPAVEAPEPAEEPGAESAEVESVEPAAGAEAETVEPTEAAEESREAAGAEVAEAQLPEVAVPRASVPWWPFICYVLVWLGGAAYAVWRIQQLPAGQAAYETMLYRTMTATALGLLVAGPVLLVVVWLASWIGRKGARVGLMFISALVKGATVTLLGAVIWIGALLVIDYLRLGRPY